MKIPYFSLVLSPPTSKFIHEHSHVTEKIRRQDKPGEKASDDQSGKNGSPSATDTSVLPQPTEIAYI